MRQFYVTRYVIFAWNYIYIIIYHATTIKKSSRLTGFIFNFESSFESAS